jgi:hypothetical protein
MTAPGDDPEQPIDGEIVLAGSPPRFNTAQVAEQQRNCYELRLRHHTLREIALMTGLSVGTVYNRINDEIERVVSPYREQFRVLERERLEGISRRLLEMMSKPHYVIQDGRVLTIDDERVEDVAVTLACMDRFMKVQIRRAALEGLDAPIKVEATQVEAPVPDEALALIEQARLRTEEAVARLREQAERA